MIWPITLAFIAAMLGAWWLVLLAFALLAATAAKWPLTRRTAVVVAIWAAALVVAVTSPASGAARLIGWSPVALIGFGIVAVVIAGGAAILSRLHRVAAQRTNQAPGMVGAKAMANPADFDGKAPLNDAELDRYARHIVLRELGGAGQRQLKAARVLIVGAGGLGSPVALYLAAAGVGQITLADDDTVSLPNLQRQILFSTTDAGAFKAQAGAERLRTLNPHINVTPLTRRITANDHALVAAHDLVIDGTDSFAARQAVNMAAVAAGVPLLAGAITQWEGQVTLYDPARGAPCLACLFPTAPAPGLAPSCAAAGVVGALPGIIGTIMALEAIKELGGVVAGGNGAGLRGQMLLFDGLWGETRRIGVTRRTGCPVCNPAPQGGASPGPRDI